MKVIEINQKLKERHLELLDLCLTLKHKGIDCFYQYGPHVDWADVTVYLKGWNADAPTIPERYDFLWTALPRDLRDEDLDENVVSASFKNVEDLIARLKLLVIQ